MTAYDKIKDRGIYSSDEEEDEVIVEEQLVEEESEVENEELYEEPIYEAAEEVEEEIYEEPGTVEGFDEGFYEEEPEEMELTPEPPSDEVLLNTKIIEEDLQHEVQQLLDFALYNGKEIPKNVFNNLYTKKLSTLIKIHKSLCDVVTPATPKTVLYMMSFHKDKKKSIFSSIPLMRNLILSAIVSVIMLIGSGLFEEVNSDNLKIGILENHGIPLLLNLIFLCSAAAVGSIFYLLSKLSKEIKKAILSKEDTSHYWARLIMGILSGLILSEVIVVNEEMDTHSVEINRLLFALLGGFSSEMVYGILEGLMERVHTLTIGTNKEEVR